MAVRRWWRFWKRLGQRAEEKGIGTNPTGVKHRSPYSCPISARSSTISSRNHRRIPVSPPLRLPVSRILPAFTRMPPRFSQKAHTCLMSPSPSRRLFLRALRLSSDLTVILFPSFCSRIYLSTRITPFSSSSILPIRLPIYP